MKRKLIACLLSVTMLCSLFPTFALATSADEEPTGTLSVICPVCNTENCTAEHKQCDICKGYDCTANHVYCETCQKYDCGTDHSVMPASDPETCTTCGVAIENCTCEKDADTCAICGNAIADCKCGEEVDTCEKCGNAIADCTCEPEVKTCPTCGEENCESDHTNWCETCRTDNCGQNHSTPTTCTTCGQENCGSQHENWCEICKADDCGKKHCDKCGTADCQLTHETWCAICKMDNCGKTHVFCETCQIYDCGNAEHAINLADEGDDGEAAPDAELSFYESLLAATTLEELYEAMTNADNAAAIAGLSETELTQLKTKAQELYNAEANKTFTDDYQLETLNMKIDSLIEKGGNQELKEHLAKCNCQPENGFHSTNCPAYIAPPTANVTELTETTVNVIGGGTETLSYAMQFATRVKEVDGEKAPDYTDLQLAYYGDWLADFVVYTNKNIKGKDAFLAGQYDLYNEDWLCIRLGDEEDLPGNTPIQLIKTMYPDLKITFDALLTLIPEFNCGVWVSDELSDFKVTVELRLYPTDASGNYNENIYHTLADIDYQPETATFTYVAGDNGSVSPGTETVQTLGTLSGSTPTANNGYHFEGWYTDESYTNRVPDSWVIAETGTLIPGTNSNGTYSTATYYAKFDPDTVDLKFELSDGKSTSTYLFTLTGEGVSLKLAVKGGESITIQDLPAGEYTITPDNNWNWRETVSVTGSGNLTQDATVAVTISDNGKKQWFNGYAYDKK